MSELTEQLRKGFTDDDYRNSYVESFMNSYVAAQIKTLREENNLTQEGLARLIGTKQAGISRLENVNYSAWKVQTLWKIARALKVRLKITFEEFGTLPGEIEGFSRESLMRLPFHKDPAFFPVHKLGSADVLKFVPRSEMGSLEDYKSNTGAAAQAEETKAYASA